MDSEPIIAAANIIAESIHDLAAAIREHTAAVSEKEDVQEVMED